MSDTTTGLLTAILAVQREAPTLAKNATNPHFKSRYTPLDTIVETIGPILGRHELVWMTLPGRDETGEPALTYRLAHAPTGEVLEGSMPLLLSKNDAQGMGSAITYARRYALCAVLNLVADDDDDGARAAQRQAKPAEPQWVAEVKALVRRNKVTTKELRALLRGAGLEVDEKANPGPLVDALSKEQAAVMLDFLRRPIPTGKSDVPGDASGFTHSPAEPDPVMAA